ncbi:exosortase F system-associated membrane protein [Flavobacteriaceae bacterium 14752]|uniref:exosortase F system-associated membrane protein n=1 Tax=Mesohalobacter salilacus TaxID=2491711 RepID=UPI000F63084A|nr:exosortase F system-associated protein [Flavobacteriaceae bacterium 14752]
MKLYLKILVFVLAITGLVCIRFFENTLFHDPLITFYDSDFQNMKFPNLNFWFYNLNLGFRFLLNSILSIAIIWVAFRNMYYIKFSVLLYCFLFVVGLFLFWFVSSNIQPKDYMVLFYIRRFLIQPLLVIILIPAFYFQKLKKSSQTNTY